MSTRPRRSGGDCSFDAACTLLEAAVAGVTRQDIVAEASHARDFTKSLLRLRDSMRAHRWRTGSGEIDLRALVDDYDRRTRAEGFHALHDWDGVSAQVNPDTIPVDVLHYIVDQRGGDEPDPVALAILLDYYFFHLLSLLSLRIWDEGDPDDNLDRLDRLLADLQGPGGSGQQFARHAETLILIATSHYEANERGYDELLSRVRTLNGRHRTRVAVAHASSMGCHLRFGFEATYARDIAAMRADNVADYPWLCYALATLMKAYADLDTAGSSATDRESVAEALLNGLSADSGAFVCDPPRSPPPYEGERAGFCALFRRHREALLKLFERYRPSDERYSPIAFFFNFSHNVLKGTVIDGLLWGEGWKVAFDDLLTAIPHGGTPTGTRETLAKTLMGYARARPHRIRGQLMPVIVYDPGAGRQAYSLAMRKAREQP